MACTVDVQVQEYVRQVRKRGLAINTSVVIAASSGCDRVMNQDVLSDAGGGMGLIHK